MGHAAGSSPHVASLFAVLVLTGGIPVSIAELLHDADDVICAPAFVVHDESAHKIGARWNTCAGARALRRMSYEETSRPPAY